MTGRERVLAAMNRRQPDRVPYGFEHGGVPDAIERLKRESGLEDPFARLESDTRHVFLGFKRIPEYSAYHGDAAGDFYVTEWGVRRDRGSMHHFSHIVSPLAGDRSEEELRNYPLPEPFPEEEGAGRVRSDVERVHAMGLAANGAMEMTIFEVAWQIRGMEDFLSDMILSPGGLCALMDRLVELRLAMARQFALGGVDVLGLGDDVSTQRGMMMAPAQWRELLKPRLAAVIAEAKRVRGDLLVKYHSDGDCSEIVPDLIEIGVDILNPVQAECMDLGRLKREYGRDISFWGTVGTQSTLPFGNPEDVRKAVRGNIEKAASGGGLYLSPTHVIEPDVPWENLVAFAEAARRYGVYCLDRPAGEKGCVHTS